MLDRARAAMDAWKNYGNDAWRGVLSAEQLWTWYSGSWTNVPLMVHQQRHDPSLYVNTRQIWRQATAIVNLYDQFVYMGDLSTNGEPLDDGTKGAIPLNPQTGGQSADGGTGPSTTDQQLVLAFSELFSMWYWQQQMSLIPKICAALGHCLTELIDDYQHGRVIPLTYWPSYVADLQLDALGHVKAYAVEYPVSIPRSTAYGREQRAESYTYRKEVDARGIWYYRDGKPFVYPDGAGGTIPSFVENVYGFAPATWDRHEAVPWQNRGMGALEKTLRQTMETNSLLSHAVDYQRKQFSAPVGVVGSSVAPRGGRTIKLPGGIEVSFPAGADPTPEDLVEAKNAAAQSMNIIGMGDTGKFVNIAFDTGDTVEMLNLVLESILAENPEARYGQELLQMQTVTGPGAERILAPVVGLVKNARKMHDPQTVKRLQMATTMMALRLKNGDVPQEIIDARPQRYAVFEPYDVDSYGRGLMDCTVAGREVFPETLLEKTQRLTLVKNLDDPWLLQQAGVPREEVDRMEAEKQAQQEQEMALLSGIAPAGPPNQRPKPVKLNA